MLIFSFCKISNIAAMYQNIDVETAEIDDVMQREKNRVLGGSVVIIDIYFGSQHYWVYCRQLSNYLLNHPG